MKNKRPSKKDLKLNLFCNNNSPSVEIRATVISSEGYDYENLSKVHRNFFPSTLRASKISLLVINRAAMGRARFMFYLWFIFFLLVTRPNFPPSQILNHATCDVYSPKAVETLIQGQCYGYCFLCLCAKYIFFWFYRSVGFEEK